MRIEKVQSYKGFDILIDLDILNAPCYLVNDEVFEGTKYNLIQDAMDDIDTYYRIN
jgi:hypothetical protein